MSSDLHSIGVSDAFSVLGLEKRAYIGTALKQLANWGRSAGGAARGASSAVRSAGGAAAEQVGQVARAAAEPVKRTVMESSAGRAMAPAVGRIAGGVKQTAQGVGNLAGATERAVTHSAARGAQGLAKRLGKDRATQARWMQGTRQALRGVPREMAVQAGTGGLLVGGMNAYMAPEGQGWEAFKSGFGDGATFGAVGGLAGGATRGLRRAGLRRQARGMAQKNPNALGGLSPNQAAEQQLRMGAGDTFKGMFSKQHAGPMGRMGNVADTAGMGAQLASEWVLPGMVLSNGMDGSEQQLPAQNPQQQVAPYPPAQVRTASAAGPAVRDESEPFFEELPKKYIGSALGSAAGYAAGGIPLGIAHEKGHLKGPAGVIARGVIPAITGLTGGVTGYNVGSKLDKAAPVVPDPQLEEFESLLKHYKEKSSGK